MDREALTRPFEPHQIRRRPGQHGKTLSYVDVGAVIARLNEAVECWHFTVEQHELLDTEVVVLGKLVADSTTKMAFGGSSITIDKSGQVVSIADDYKAAASDSLKKCASLLGVPVAGGQTEADAPRERTSEQGARVTSRQLAALHSSARHRGMSRDALAHLVHQRTGAPELAQLTKSQASELISELSGSNGGGR